MELYEQQSTYNPNMPIREFMYPGKLYDKFIHSARLNRYGKKLLPLPLPKLVVFYNGEDNKEDEAVLSLSTAFREEIRQNVMRRRSENAEKADDAEISAEVEQIFRSASPDIEVNVRMINIHHGHNKKLLTACRPLEEYAWFVEQARKNLSAGRNAEPSGIGEAIDKAIDEMPEDFEIKKFITANRAEVKDMCLTEYNETETMEMMKEEGRQETMVLNIKNLMDSTGWTAEKAMDSLKIPKDQRLSLYADLFKDA